MEHSLFLSKKNIADSNDTPKFISTVHKEAHKLGIKTLYYLRTESVLRGDNLQRTNESCVSCEG